MSEAAHITETAHAMADAARRAILPHFRAEGGLAADNKAADHFDPVTVADRAAEEAMRAILAERRPDDGILGEEFGHSEGTSGLTWVLDPIDGTRAFIAGLPTWGTLIGLTRNGVPVRGLMHQPYLNEIFTGDGRTARLRGPAGERTLRTRRCADLAHALMATTDPRLFAEGEEAERFRALEPQVRLSRYGTDCYAYCMLAAGQVDLVVEAGLKPYDICALIPIIEGAGGRVTSWDGGSAAQGGRVVAAGDPRLHEAALKALNP